MARSQIAASWQGLLQVCRQVVSTGFLGTPRQCVYLSPDPTGVCCLLQFWRFFFPCTPKSRTRSQDTRRLLLLRIGPSYSYHARDVVTSTTRTNEMRQVQNNRICLSKMRCKINEARRRKLRKSVLGFVPLVDTTQRGRWQQESKEDYSSSHMHFWGYYFVHAFCTENIRLVLYCTSIWSILRTRFFFLHVYESVNPELGLELPSLPVRDAPLHCCARFGDIRTTAVSVSFTLRLLWFLNPSFESPPYSLSTAQMSLRTSIASFF